MLLRSLPVDLFKRRPPPPPPNGGPSYPYVTLDIWRSDAVVMFDWLMSVDLNEVPITHPAQKQALMDLLTRLEETEVRNASSEEIAAAQQEVAQDMGW